MLIWTCILVCFSSLDIPLIFHSLSFIFLLISPLEYQLQSGITAFRLVSRTGDADIAKLLLEAGADTEGKTVVRRLCSHNGFPWSFFACTRFLFFFVFLNLMYNHLFFCLKPCPLSFFSLLFSIPRHFRRYQVGDTAIINAARWGNADIVMHLLEAGADKDVQEDVRLTLAWKTWECINVGFKTYVYTVFCFISMVVIDSKNSWALEAAFSRTVKTVNVTFVLSLFLLL